MVKTGKRKWTLLPSTQLKNHFLELALSVQEILKQSVATRGFALLVSLVRIGRMRVMRFCNRCGMSENDIDETIYSCNCVKGKVYDLDRALSEIEGFFNEGVSNKDGGDWLAYPHGKDNSTRGRD
jgi:hypothetical protein